MLLSSILCTLKKKARVTVFSNSIFLKKSTIKRVKSEIVTITMQQQ